MPWTSQLAKECFIIISLCLHGYSKINIEKKIVSRGAFFIMT